jgi:beta-barrel assembly-enhancing protease
MVRGRFVMVWTALRFETDGAPFVLPLDMAALELGEDPNWIVIADRRQPDLRFQVSRDILDNDHFCKVVSIRKQLAAQLGGKEMTRRVKLTLAFVVGFILIAWVAANAMGWGVRMAVKRIPAQQEIKFGDEAFKKMEPRLALLPDETNAVKQLAALAAPLLASVPSNGIPFRFYLTIGPPNAFALPGGRIVVTSGLLELLDKPEELVGVLAHESAHVTQRHLFQHMISGKGPVFLLQILTGGHNKMFNLLALPSEMLAYESFSQKYEREADAYGWDYLVAAKINPHGMIDALRKLREHEFGSHFTNRASAFDSHPDLDQRIRWLEAKWQALPDKENFVALTNPVPKLNLDSRMTHLIF